LERCKTSPHYAINTYLNPTKDSKKTSNALELLKDYDNIEVINGEYNIECISIMALYMMIFFHNRGFCFYNKTNNEIFNMSLIDLYKQCQFRLKPFLIHYTFDKFYLSNGSKFIATVLLDSIKGQRFDYFIFYGQNDELKEISKITKSKCIGIVE
jgi:hypothetical protein